MKIAVVSPLLPPTPSGQSNVLYHLMRPFDPDEYCLISHTNYADGLATATKALPAPTYYISVTRTWPTRTSDQLKRTMIRLSGRVRGSWAAYLELEMERREVRQRAAQIRAIIRDERCDLAIGATGDLYDFPATYLACKQAGIPFVAYLFDSYAGQWQFDSRTAPVARAFEGDCIRNAAAILGLNEFTVRDYRETYGVEATIIRNPLPTDELAAANTTETIFEPGTKNIVFTGSIYHINYDNFRSLSVALDHLGRDDVFLHIYTAQAAEQIAGEGVNGEHVVIHEHVPYNRAWAIQKQADILFMPLGFDEVMRKVVNSSAPGKLGEYLASGRPVLVHAPEDSFLNWYFTKHQCGVVVTENSPAALAEAIRTILEDDMRMMIHAAQERARQDFDLSGVIRQFRTCLESLL